MLIGKKLMVFSFTVNSHSRSRYLLVFSTFSIQFEQKQFRIQKGTPVVNQDNVISWYCEIKLCWFLSFSSSKSGLLQISAKGLVVTGFCTVSPSSPSCTLAERYCAVAELAEVNVCQFTAQRVNFRSL